ncbi:uncharacterized protein LOC123309402 isoform X2 [Coccinella septempunctata]|uniref:uncharacterized protein LOC123309402 isoform X2 n=1 Tax=Coccinella septempunctata TaxID=41139 RepID=UPI001D065ADE|nr:uncharacterized protein LOC123309402 isoform X2 [Coccinella septempunctata]
MNLFDCQLQSNPSVNHSYPGHQANFEHLEVSNPHTDSVNDSSGSTPEVTTSPFVTSSVQKNPEKGLQRAIYKGPDVFGKVLGPTADESILVGLQALIEMAGTLEFTSFTPDPSVHETPFESIVKESREASEPISQSTASCQYGGMEKNNVAPPEVFPEELKPEVMSEVRKKPCKYIITQENIAASMNGRRSKCQHSQTRVLPSSMTSYNPDRADYPGDRSSVNLPCHSFEPPKSPMKCQLRTVSPPARRPRQLSPPGSGTTTTDCPCSQFYHQMTTISVLGNSPGDAPSCLPCPQKRTQCELIEQPTIIFPNTVDPSVVTATGFREKKSLASEPTKETISTFIQTIPIPRPKMSNAEVETESTVTQKKSSVACDCNFCIPISAGVSKPPSRVSNVCKVGSSVRFADEACTECMCSACCVPREKVAEKAKERKDSPVRRNKSCTCSLIPKGVRVADAAISCLKVNTSCQYCKSEITTIESRSTQCGKQNRRRDSCIQICSESGDCRPQRKKSVRILGGPYECRDFSETRYCMEPEKSISRSVLPLLDCNDEISKLCFEKPARVCLEMGDSYIPPPMEVRYAITKITKFRDFSTFEVMKSTSKKPKCIPKAVEGVFVLKKEENYCSSKTYE